MERIEFKDAMICSASAGAAGELRVAADLLQKGYDVFRSVSPACFCDLIAIKDGETLTVEVKTGSSYTKYSRPVIRESDLLAIVTPDSILYQIDKK